MKKQLSHTLLLLVLLLTSCYRDELCFLHPTGARIRIIIKYESVGLYPDKSYIGIYNGDNGEFIREELMTSPNLHELSLGVGRYNLVVYNEPLVEGEYSTAHTVDFSLKGLWDSFKAFATDEPAQSQPAPRSDGRTVANIQDQLAVARITEFEVTPDMINLRHDHPTKPEDIEQNMVIDTTLYFYPRRVFTKVNIEMLVVNYPGWTLRRNNGNRPRLYGSADAYQLGTDTYLTEPSTQYVEMINGGSRSSGQTSANQFVASFYTVGLPNNTLPSPENSYPYTLFLRFEHGSAASPVGVEIRPIVINLVTGENADFVSMTLTRAGQPHPANGKRYYNDILDVTLVFTLPERIPIGEDSEADLEDWNDQDVPLDTPPMLYFQPNGAGGILFSWRYPVGTLLYLPAPTSFTPPKGYRFKEWNTKNDGSGTGFQPGSPYPMPRGGATLFVIYEKITGE